MEGRKKKGPGVYNIMHTRIDVASRTTRKRKSPARRGRRRRSSISNKVIFCSRERERGKFLSPPTLHHLCAGDIYNGSAAAAAAAAAAVYYTAARTHRKLEKMKNAGS